MKIFEVMTLLACCIVLLMESFFVRENEEFRGPFNMRLDIAARVSYCFFSLQSLACAILVIVK